MKQLTDILQVGYHKIFLHSILHITYYFFLDSFFSFFFFLFSFFLQTGNPEIANCAPYSYCMAKYAFGWAVKGLNEVNDVTTMPVSLQINPWKAEPDTRSGKKSEALQGTLTVTSLKIGTKYDIYRWDVVTFANYTNTFLKISFTASNETYVYVDDTSFESSGTAYYKCIVFWPPRV